MTALLLQQQQLLLLQSPSTIALILIGGAIIGSFLSVCIYRIPLGRYEPVRENIRELSYQLTLTSPRRSICPNCEHTIAWYHNIPIISWVIILHGRCAHCKAPIPLRYPLVELLGAAAALGCYLRFGPSLTAMLAFALVSALIVITFIDIDYMIIPNVITYPGIAVGVGLGILQSSLKAYGGAAQATLSISLPFVQSIWDSALGIAFGGGTLYLVWWFYLAVRKREGLGLGDIKLLAMIGALLGYECALATIFIGSILGSIVGVTLIALRRHSFSMHLSFGPYLAIAACCYIFAL